MLSPLSPAGPAGPINRKSGTGMPVVGMVGGGQLARMTAAAAVGLGVTFRVLAESESESAALVTHDVTVGSHLSLPDIAAFADKCDVITFDHEHVPGPILAELESAGVLVRPGSGALRYTQDKLAMRERLSALGIPCPRYAPVSTVADVTAFARGLPERADAWPVVLKAVSGGYDGKGVRVCRSAAEGRRGHRAWHRAAGRGVRAVHPGTGGAGGPVAVWSGRRLPGGADRAGRRHLPGGDRPRPRAPRGWRCGPRRWPC